MGPPESNEVQQGQVQGVALGLGQSQICIQAGRRTPWELSYRGLEDASGQIAGHEPAVCSYSLGGQLYTGLYMRGCQ